VKGRAIIARGAPVSLPGPLAISPAYPTLAEIEQRFLMSIAFQSPRTGATYRDGMQRFDHFLAVAGVDQFTMTADDAQLPEDVLEHFFRWLTDSGYSRGTIETYLGGVKAFWRFTTAKRYMPPRFSYDAMRAGLAMVIGKHKIRSPRIDARLPLILTHVDSLPLPDLGQRLGIAGVDAAQPRRQHV